MEAFADLIFNQNETKISKSELATKLKSKSDELGQLAYLAKSKKATEKRKKLFEITAKGVLDKLVGPKISKQMFIDAIVVAGNNGKIVCAEKAQI